jgi:hypothetical protein
MRFYVEFIISIQDNTRVSVGVTPLVVGTVVFEKTAPNESTFHVCDAQSFAESPAFITDNVEFGHIQEEIKSLLCQ